MAGYLLDRLCVCVCVCVHISIQCSTIFKFAKFFHLQSGKILKIAYPVRHRFS